MNPDRLRPQHTSSGPPNHISRGPWRLQSRSSRTPLGRKMDVPKSNIYPNRLARKSRLLCRPLLSTAESRSAVAVPSPLSFRIIAVDTLVCEACNLDELPRTSSEILALPEMRFNAFVASLYAQEIRGVAMITIDEELDLLSTFTADDSVLLPPAKSQTTWDSLRTNPYFDLLPVFADVFPDEVPSRLPVDKGIRHEIDLLPGTKYCVTWQWPLPREFFAARKAAGHGRERISPHSSPTFSIKKPNGKWRIVHAFNNLNTATIPAQTPIPRKGVIIDGMDRSSILADRRGHSNMEPHSIRVRRPGRHPGSPWVHIPWTAAHKPRKMLRLTSRLCRRPFHRHPARSRSRPHRKPGSAWRTLGDRKPPVLGPRRAIYNMEIRRSDKSVITSRARRIRTRTVSRETISAGTCPFAAPTKAKLVLPFANSPMLCGNWPSRRFPLRSRFNNTKTNTMMYSNIVWFWCRTTRGAS
ncbi:hypothetical protein H257_03231 [Aphanomyces astaci]|uniref:Uncharacterized protein n=1 Tax=Aphanomyces astaci TaxID=112090 RepID=W4H2N9_APHAT|nr:hypothetical protein H257_03231 [Aphanomyces astaci]ETV85509.1 hypothetical protein H257_03231 [Aphanomyces astaci]|eukprot:XP_009825527.1 hypothetical protein H257_03231 [Aphanomyces astaci]